MIYKSRKRCRIYRCSNSAAADEFIAVQAAEENIRIHLDYENGKPVYEGSIVYDGIEYDFEIDAAAGYIAPGKVKI